MSNFRIVISLLAVALGAGVGASPAAAQTPVSCSTMVNGFLDAGDGWLDGVGTRVTARGFLGFSSFTMHDGFQIETTPLHTPAAATQSVFYAPKVSGNAFSGYFHDVFPGRGNGDEDRWRIWVGRGGQFWLLSMTWGGPWLLLQSPVCYAGPSGQLVVTAHIDQAPGFGTDYWSFVMQRDFLY